MDVASSSHITIFRLFRMHSPPLPVCLRLQVERGFANQIPPDAKNRLNKIDTYIANRIDL
jgi:hypothetical protein